MGVTKKSEYELSFIAFNFFYNLIAWSLFFWLPVYLQNIGFSPQQIGFLSSIQFLALFLITPLGLFSDRVSPKIWSFISLLFFSAAVFFIALLKHFDKWLAAPIFFVTGVGTGGFLLTFRAWYYKVASRRPTATGLFFIASHLGFGIGPFLSGFSMRILTPQRLYLFISGAIVIMAIAVLFLKDVHLNKKANYRISFLNPVYFPLLILSFAVGSHYGTERVSYAPFLNKVLGLTSSQIGTIFLFVALSLIFANAFGSKYMESGRLAAVLLRFGLLVSGFFQVLTGLTWNFFSVTVVRILHTCGDSLVILSQNVLLREIFLRESVGGGISALRFSELCGMAFGAMAAGFLAQKLNFRVPFWFNGLFLIVVTVIIFMAYGKSLFRRR